MATIALYAEKVNQMYGLLGVTNDSLFNYKSELMSFKDKIIGINTSIYNTDEVITSINSSTQIQESRADAQLVFMQNMRNFIADADRIDGKVADIITPEQR
jgi:hypothetical protein